jgi:hypothetical protein
MTSSSLAPDETAEDARVRALDDLGIAPTLPEERFDRMTRLAQHLFGVSMASVTLIDRDTRYHKSRQGSELVVVPRELAFCDHTIRAADTMVVEDMAADTRSRSTRRSSGIRTYASTPGIRSRRPVATASAPSV